MIQDNITYDSVRDLGPVVEGLDIDIAKAMETGVVIDSGTAVEYNDISDPDLVLGRVHDVFEAMDAQKNVLKAGKKASSEPQKSPVLKTPPTGETE